MVAVNASSVNDDDDVAWDLTWLLKVRLQERCILRFCCPRSFSVSPPMNSIWSCTPLPSNLLHHGDLLDLDADMKEIFLERLPTGISLLFYIYNDDWWSRLQLSVLYPTLHNYFLKCILLNSLFNSTFAFQGKMSKNKSSSVAFFYLPASPDSFASMGAVPVLIVSVLHQNEGGIGKSIPDAQEISRDSRDVLRPSVLGRPSLVIFSPWQFLNAGTVLVSFLDQVMMVEQSASIFHGWDHF